ncbi:MAG TPA: autotransporter-associated beta strand repeat-containing protein, partial [Candidatus Saccharimonadales bacterium]|nr:autotransporter-associated beta strand repeat-containing protein [Candidatus Saccharimonadales bacterium]
MNNLVKTPLVSLLFPLLIFAALTPRGASGALSASAWDITIAPAATNATFGTVSSLIATVTIGEGSKLVSSGTGVTLSVAVSPVVAGVTASLASNGPFTANGATTTLTISSTATAAAGTYNITVTGSNTSVYTNQSSLNVGDPFVYNIVAAGATGPGMIWSPPGTDTNWSTAVNWSPAGPPAITNDVEFIDLPSTSAGQGIVDNVVNNSFFVGSLTYGQTNSYHTTLISPGKTLTVGGDALGLNAGTGTADGNIQTVTTITGAGGSLIVSNSAAAVNIGQSQPQTGTGNSGSLATLDLSGLGAFNAAVGGILVGVDTSQALRGAGGVLKLAQTNSLALTSGSTAPQIDIGDNTQSGASPGFPSILLLGQTNTFFADSIAVGRGKTASFGGPSMLFNSSFASPAAWFRGASGGTNRVGTWTIGDAWDGKSSQNYGTNDFSLGTVNALVDQMFVGRGASTANGTGANVAGNGTLIFGAGTLNVNTLQIGVTLSAVGSGAVTISGGSLVVNTNLELANGSGSAGVLSASNATLTANAGITVGGGTASVSLQNAALGATNGNATIGTAGAPLSSFGMTNSILTLGAQGGGPVIVATSFACDVTNTINLASLPLVTRLPFQFPVIAYAGSDGNLGSIALGSLPAPYIGYISNNTAQLSVDVVITTGPIFYPLVWTGSPTGAWDINTTANWTSNHISVTYPQGYPEVQFDDTLTGTSNVALTTILTPMIVSVNNSVANYVFSGPGKISGAGSLVKSGSGTLTLAESGGNDFTGGLAINGGTVQAGAGSNAGSLGAGAVSLAAGGTLVFDRSDNVSISNVISGSGTLAQNGGGILTLGGSNTAFSGKVIVAQGTLRADTATALGTADGSVTITNAATLDVNSQSFNNAQPVTVSGAGVGGNGAIVNNGASNATQVLRVVTLAGNTTFGGSNGWGIHSSGNAASDASLTSANPANLLTKVGTNTVTLFGVTVDNSVGNINVQDGTLSVQRNMPAGLGNPTNTVTVFTNATLQVQNLSNVITKVIALNDGGTLQSVSTNELGGAVILNSGTGTIAAGAGAQLTLDAAISGAGGLVKNGAGVLTLESPSAYTGPTLISAGTLALTNTGSSSGSIDSSVNISL